MNQVKNRLQALGLLDRSFGGATDEELDAAVAALDDDHRDALVELAGADADAAAIREAIAHGRLDGTLEGVALVLTDACLADCIEQLGDHAENPTSDQLREVLPGHRRTSRCGDHPHHAGIDGRRRGAASVIIRDLLKHDDLVKLPPVEPRPLSPMVQVPEIDEAEREAIKAKRKEMKERKQAAAHASREQAARARHRA